MAKSHIFKDNTKPPVTGKRKQDALSKLKILADVYSPARDLCLDIIKVIKDLDGLPNGVLREISELKIDKENPSNTLEKVRGYVPQNYHDSILETAERANESGRLIVLSEELTV